jgi:predicted amidohydrolase YtcJ
MWIAVQRTPRRTDQVFHAEQRISREEAIRLYTINNAYLTFEEKQKGSLEADKLADFIILDRDILSCPIDDLRSAEVLSTYVGGKMVYQK